LYQISARLYFNRETGAIEKFSVAEPYWDSSDRGNGRDKSYSSTAGAAKAINYSIQWHKDNWDKLKSKYPSLYK
jgi:hypothetical protein